MIFLPTLVSRNVPGKSHTENEDPALSPKRSFAQHIEDHLSQLEPKRRHVRPDGQPSRRAPLDPLSASDLENRSSRRSRSTDIASYHSIATPSTPPDLRVLHPGQHISSDSRGMRCSNTSGAPVCSWPPPIPTPSTDDSLKPNLLGQQPPLHRSAEKSTRGDYLSPTSTTHFPDSSQTEPTTTMVKLPRATEWKSENVLQPIRSRTNSLPSVRRPPEELWRSDSGPTKAAYESVDIADPLVCPTPPGLPSPPPRLRRSGSLSGLLPHGSVSLSLAPGSQPLRVSEYTKAVSPIGAERNRVVSITLPHIRNSPVAKPHDPPHWCSPRKTDTKWNTPPPEKMPMEAERTIVPKEDLERLLRHAARNKHAPRIISPLSPLRATTPAFDLSADPTYRLHVPSQLNIPSPRYSNRPPSRARTVCDSYQSVSWDTTCMHCKECKRDSVGKRLLAFRYRQHQTHHIQHNKLLMHPARGANTPIVDDDCIILTNRIRETFAYEMDDEEKGLWDEVAAITGGEPVLFSRVGVPCAAATHLRAMDSGSDDGAREDYLEIADEGLLATESTLLRDVSVY